ncbi:MAG: protein translocase subunit SecD [Alphaproteobacteria bacterium]|nr:protein translocase subunit SecD [Alphaproteobacteria bacterium]
MPGWWQPVSLGLDLQGGSHLLIEVGLDAVVAEQLTNLSESARTALRGAGIRHQGLSVEGGAVVMTIAELEKLEEARRVLRDVDRTANVAVGENGAVRMGFDEKVLNERRDAAVLQSIEIVRRRVDETGTREATIQRQGLNRIIVELPGVNDPERIKRLLGKTAKLTLHLVDERTPLEEAMAGRVPPGSQLLPSSDPQGPPKYLVRKRVEVSGDALVGAQPTYEDGRPVVSFRFNAPGGKKFGKVTQENVGKNLAIVLDGRVISAPVIRSPILGGNGIISGSFSTQEAQDLALLLRAGALPAPLTYLEERTVGPGLGADSIRAGSFASGLGLLLVIVFMVLAYGLFGVFANVALLMNMALLLGSLSAIGATLTLPGIAGIVLTMGMAVDANVLIYERMREEARNGRTTINAIEAGFSRAFITILDSNLTTLVAGLLMFQFGSGPVRGFAVTLGVGILTSMFSAIMVTRLLVSVWVRRTKPKSLPI